MSIRPYITLGEFEPEVIAAMSAALDAACAEIHFAATSMVRQVMAERIIASARTGERDLASLRAAALAGMPREED
jgi:hypothetical protein